MNMDWILDEIKELIILGKIIALHYMIKISILFKKFMFNFLYGLMYIMMK